jgi:preprotein translocase subunit SecE
VQQDKEMNKIINFFREYADELLYKVQWPGIAELQGSTVTVLITSLIIALIIALLDLVFRVGMTTLYGLF